MLYRYCFSSTAPMSHVDDSLMLAVLAAESLHGRSAVRLDARFCLDPNQRSCVVDADTDVGRDIARILSGLLEWELGVDSFRVETVEGAPELEEEHVHS